MARGGLRGQNPQNLADQLTLFKPGGRLCPHIYASPPGFKKLSTPLYSSGQEIQIQIRIPQTESNQGIPIVTLYLFINLSLPEYIHQSTT